MGIPRQHSQQTGRAGLPTSLAMPAGVAPAKRRTNKEGSNQPSPRGEPVEPVWVATQTLEQQFANETAPNQIDQGEPFPRGFFDCCGDFKTCCCGCCCYCYLHASNAEIAGTGQCDNSKWGTCCLMCVCCAPAHCFLSRDTRTAIRVRYDLEERGAGMCCCDGDTCSHCWCPCCASVQEARTLAFFEAKGEPFERTSTYEIPPGQQPEAAVGLPIKKAKKSGYGNLPPHHPAAQQAANVARREEIAEKEADMVRSKCEKRLVRAALWFKIEHSAEFPGPGKRLAMRGPFKRYMDAQRHGVTCDAGAPKWWEVSEVEPQHKTAVGEAVVIKFKKKVLRGEGGATGAMQVLPSPCSDEWKAIHKGIGKFLLMNEEGLFLRCEKDGSLAMGECNWDDVNSFRPFVWEVKFK